MAVTYFTASTKLRASAGKTPYRPNSMTCRAGKQCRVTSKAGNSHLLRHYGVNVGKLYCRPNSQGGQEVLTSKMASSRINVPKRDLLALK